MKKILTILVDGNDRGVKTFTKIMKFWNKFAANHKMYELPELENYKIKVLEDKVVDKKIKGKK